MLRDSDWARTELFARCCVVVIQPYDQGYLENMMKRLISTAAAMILLAGCQTTSGDNKADEAAQNPAIKTEISDADCGADKVQSFIGQEATDAVRAEVASKSGAKSIRWLTPNAMITMDLRYDRLNAHLGTDNKIGSFRCG